MAARPYPGNGSGGFTLAELLTVLIIVSLLLAATVPALQGVSASTRHTAALRLLSSLLEEARSLAIAEHGTVYLVLNDPTPDQLRPALALYRETETGDGLPEAISAWHPLPGNLAFYRETGDEGHPSLFNAPAAVRPPRAFPLAGHDTPQELAYLAFGPTGEITAPNHSRYARIILARHAAADPTSPVASLEAFQLSLFTGRATYETVPLTEVPPDPPPR